MTRIDALKRLLTGIEAGEWPDDGAPVYKAGEAEAFEAALGPNWEDASLAYYGSLDAAKALHDAMLPGRHWGRSPSPGHQFWVKSPQGPFVWSGSAATVSPARAWLASILRSLIAEAEA